MTLADDQKRKVWLKQEDFLFAKSRELMRQRNGMITSEDAYNLAVRKYVPKQVRALSDEYFRSGNFRMYRLTENLFFNKDPAVRAAAAQELDDLLRYYQDPNT